MGKTFEKKISWKDKETKKNFKKSKKISALRKYRYEYDDFQEDNKLWEKN